MVVLVAVIPCIGIPIPELEKIFQKWRRLGPFSRRGPFQAASHRLIHIKIRHYCRPHLNQKTPSSTATGSRAGEKAWHD